MWKWTACEMKWRVLGDETPICLCTSNDDVAPDLHSVPGGDALTTIVSINDALGCGLEAGLHVVERRATRTGVAAAVQGDQNRKGRPARNSIARR